MSYDSEEQLRTFADGHDVTYDLLSDPDSAVIRKFGILNTLISPNDPEQGAERSFYGIPFPGVYVTDEAGVVTEKFFHRYYGTRDSGGAIRDSALGEILARHEVPTAELSTDQVKVSAFLSDSSLKFETQSTIYVRFELEEGLHIYGRPLPDGYIASEVTIPDTPGLRIGDAVYPATSPRAFPELGVTLNVYEGAVDVERGFDREDHTFFQEDIVFEIDKRWFDDIQPDGVANTGDGIGVFGICRPLQRCF